MKNLKRQITGFLLALTQLTAVPAVLPASAAGQATLYGDTDCSGMVDIADAVLLARIIAEDKDAAISMQGRWNADADLSGSLDQNDTITILKIIAKLITPPAVQPAETTTQPAVTTTASTTATTVTTKTTTTTAKTTTATTKATTSTTKATTATTKATTTTTKATTATTKATTTTTKATTATTKATTTKTTTTITTTKATTTTTVTTAPPVDPKTLDANVKLVKNLSTLKFSKNALEQKVAARLEEDIASLSEEDAAVVRNYSVIYSYESDPKGNICTDYNQNFILMYDPAVYEKDKSTALSGLIDKKNKAGISWTDQYVEYLTALNHITGVSRDGYLTIFSDIGSTAYSAGSYIGLPRSFMDDLASGIYGTTISDHWSVNWAAVHEASHSYRFEETPFNFYEEYCVNMRSMAALHSMNALDSKQIFVTETNEDASWFHSPYDQDDYTTISAHQYITRGVAGNYQAFKAATDLSTYDGEMYDNAFFLEATVLSYLTAKPVWDLNYTDYAAVEKNFTFTDNEWDMLYAMMIVQPENIKDPVMENALKIYQDYMKEEEQQSTCELYYYFLCKARSDGKLTNTVVDRINITPFQMKQAQPFINQKDDYANSIHKGMLHMEEDLYMLKFFRVLELLSAHGKDSARTERIAKINSIKNTAGTFDIMTAFSHAMVTPKENAYDNDKKEKDSLVDIILTNEGDATAFKALGIYTLGAVDEKTEKDVVSGQMNWVIRSGDQNTPIKDGKNVLHYEGYKFTEGEYTVINEIINPNGLDESKTRYQVFCFRTPTALTVETGKKATLSTTAFNDSRLHYAWQKYDETNKKWTAVANATKAEMQIQPVSGDKGKTIKYRCVITCDQTVQLVTPTVTVTVK